MEALSFILSLLPRTLAAALVFLSRALSLCRAGCLVRRPQHAGCLESRHTTDIPGPTAGSLLSHAHPACPLRGGRSAQTRADLIPRVLAQMDNLCSHSQTNVGLLRFPLLLETTMTRPFSHHFPPHIRVLDIFLPEATRSLPMPPLSPLPPTPTPTQNMFPQKADTLLPNLAILVGPLSPSHPPGALLSSNRRIYHHFKTNICRFPSHKSPPVAAAICTSPPRRDSVVPSSYAVTFGELEIEGEAGKDCSCSIVFHFESL